MDDIHRSVLNRETPYLTENLKLDEAFLGQLMDKEIVRRIDKAEIEKSDTPLDRILTFIDLVQRRGPTAFQCLIDTLVKTEQKPIANYLLEKTEIARKKSNETDELYHSVVQRNLVYLGENLKASPELMAHLRKAGALHPDDVEEVEEDEKENAKASTLCEVFIRQCPCYFEDLLEALEATGQGRVAKALKEFELEAIRQLAEGEDYFSSSRGPYYK